MRTGYRILGGFLLALTVVGLCSGSAYSQYQGVWKDNTQNPTHNFYIQHYSVGSTLVVYTTDAVTYYAFNAALTENVFDADSMDMGNAMTLRITFHTEDAATAILTDNLDPSAIPFIVPIHKEFPAVRTAHSGIWKDPTGVFSMYVQDYETGSSVVVYTFDAVGFQAFLGGISGPLFSAFNMAGQTEVMTLIFEDSYSATVDVSPTAGTAFQPMAADFTYEVTKLYEPAALDIDFTATPRTGQIPLEVQFADASKVPNTGWVWDFGDGSATSTAPNPVHTYETPGIYSVSLFATDGTRGTFTFKRDYVHVSPRTSFIVSGTVTFGAAGLAGTTITFDGVGSTISGASGYYSMEVPLGWSGTATPSQPGFVFAPPSRMYLSVTTDRPDEDYTAEVQLLTVSGTVMLDGSGLPGVSISFSGAGSVTTGASGTYSIQVPYGWNGVARPEAEGYLFDPGQISYSAVVMPLTNQNYTAQVQMFEISGSILFDGSGLEGVLLTIEDLGSTTTDASGHYETSVPYQWSGSITPSKTGYAFIPESMAYSSVTSDQTDQDYTAEVGTVTISGTIASMTAGVEGVTVHFTGIEEQAVTDASGHYSIEVPYAWTGTATPSKPAHLFSPVSKDYFEVTADQTDQNYLSLDVVTISGTVTAGGSGLAGVTMTVTGVETTTTTDETGSYICAVPLGWSGTISPSKLGFLFTPVSRTWAGLTVHVTNINFTALQIFLTVSGRVYLPQIGLPTGIGGVVMDFGDQGAVTTNSTGYYTKQVPYNWTGTVTPAKAGYQFEPPSREYTDVTTDQLGQDYVARITRTITGVITVDGEPLEGVTVSFTAIAATAVTDETGRYTMAVLHGWSGVATPSKTGYQFTPPSRTYPSVTTDLSGQDYTATEL